MAQKVIYIAGRGHSGSTILDLILGSNSRIESVGEVTMIGLRRLFANDPGELPCTCGASFPSCPYWQTILPKLREAGIEKPEDLVKHPTPERTRAFISEVLRHSGRSVYLESSKSSERLKTLLETPGLDVYTLQIVRDPRATALSVSRKHGRFYAYARSWERLHARVERLIEGRPERTLQVSYEALTLDPEGEVRRIMDFCGEPFEPGQLDFFAHPHHNITGNRLRSSGNSRIRPDTAYLDSLSFARWYGASLLCLRPLLRFRYPLLRATMRKRLAAATAQEREAAA